MLHVMRCLAAALFFPANELQVNKVIFAESQMLNVRNMYSYVRKWINKQNKLRGLSPQANYTDQATAACRRS
jgi:hypothetical protein